MYQLAAFDPMGVSPEGVIAVGKEMGVKDIFEVLYKVAELTRQLRDLAERQKKIGQEASWQAIEVSR